MGDVTRVSPANCTVYENCMYFHYVTPWLRQITFETWEKVNIPQKYKAALSDLTDRLRISHKEYLSISECKYSVTVLKYIFYVAVLYLSKNIQ